MPSMLCRNAMRLESTDIPPRAILEKVKAGDRIYDYRYFYADLEGALKKISRLIEKDGLPQFSPLISSIERVERVHLEMQEYIKEACRNYAYRDDN